jgi:hypothetical protein
MLVIDPAVMDNLVMDTLVMDTLTCLLPTSCVVPVYKSPKDYPFGPGV